MTERLSAQIDFLKAADRLKTVERANALLDLSRPENSAEHSWHLALWALVFSPIAEPGVSIDRVIRMLILHDLVEVEVGDHPIHLETDWESVAIKERAAAESLFGLLPLDQKAVFLSLWNEFEADETLDARFAKRLDRCQPLFQVLCAPVPRPDHMGIVRENLNGGRAAYLRHEFPEAYRHAMDLLNGSQPDHSSSFSSRLPFLVDADQLKSVNRASRLLDNSRCENSAEHSWHIMLYAWVLAEYAHPEVRIDRVLRMLLLHDIVEIDAGDHPIHGQVDHAAQAEKEMAAAARLFGLLPSAQKEEFTDLWLEFENAETQDALFGKAVDRIQTPIANLQNGGGTWIEYQVSFDQLESRVGYPVKRGAPELWQWLQPQLKLFFDVIEPVN